MGGRRASKPKEEAAKESAPTTPIFDLARKKWKSSGLTDDHAKRLHLQPMPGEEVEELGSNFKKAGGVLIPYFDLKGKPTKFFRVRYLEKLPGFAGTLEKPQRYVQPADTINEVYLPPILPVSWEDIAKDVNVTIYVTEGEFKAACAAAHGLACIGLGGVDVWRSTKRNIPLLAPMNEIEWKNRNVVIVYDSDAATNPNVVRAERQLAQKLLSIGAIPAVASLPAGKEGAKQGLDDYLVHHGEEDLLKVVQEAPRFPEADALWGMNEEVLFVRDPGLVVVQDSGQRLDPGKFVSSHYSNRHYLEITEKDGAPVAKKKPLAKRWMEWEHRFEVDKISYDPGQPRMHEGSYNAWPGWAVEPKKGDVGPFLWLLEFLFRSDPQWLPWFLKWLAYPIQNPGTKMYTATMIWGRGQGTGKSFVFYALGGIYGDNFIEIKNKHLRSGFNSWAKHKQFVYGDEIAGNDARLDAEEMKTLITQNRIPINEKFLPEYTIEDRINYGFTGQNPDALFMDDDDRRYFVHEVVGEAGEKHFYDLVHRWLHGDGPVGSYKGRGAAHLFQYLLDVDTSDFDPTARAPYTDARQSMIMNGKSDIAFWCSQLREDPMSMLKPIGEKAARDCELFTPTILLRAYDPEGRKKVTVNGVARELVKAGFRQVNVGCPIRTKAGLVRLYAIRNWEHWLNTKTPMKQIAAHFETFFGPDSGRF